MTEQITDAEANELYAEYSRLMSLPDALDEGSETARQVAEVDAKLKVYEQQQADIMRHSERVQTQLANVEQINELLNYFRSK